MWLCLASGHSERQQNYDLRVAELIDLDMPRSLLTRNADEAIVFKPRRVHNLTQNSHNNFYLNGIQKTSHSYHWR